jgi:hypothetical protein
MHVCTHTHTHTYTHALTYIHTHTYIPAVREVFNKNDARTHISRAISYIIYTHTFYIIYIYIYMHTHAYINTRTHTYIPAVRGVFNKNDASPHIKGDLST